MKTRLILKPEQRGTKSLAKTYGDDLVCVRFRYDENLRQRLKTIELIIERVDWEPPTPKYPPSRLVPLRIEGYELDLRSQVKASGGKWDPKRRLWFVKYGNIKGTPLEKHIHTDTSYKTE